MKLGTGISPNYVKEWTTEKALREVLQNYLDTLQEFKCKGRVSWRNGIVTVSDNGPGIEMKHLALGISEKGPNAKGQFGEGLKLAMLVMAREGRKMTIATSDQTIIPTIEKDPNFGTELLFLQVKKNVKSSTFTGTRIRCECSEEELDRAKSYFVEFLVKGPNFRWVEKDNISLPGGYVFMNNTRIGEISGARFSYHLYGDLGIGNRDREVIDIDLVHPHIQLLLMHTKSTQVINRCVLDAIERYPRGEAKIATGHYIVPKELRPKWREAFKTLTQKDTLLSSGNYATDNYAQELGYNVIQLNYEWQNFFQYLGLPSTETILKRKTKKVTGIPLTQLTEEENENLRLVKRLVRRFYREPGKIIILSKIYDIAAGGKSVDGYYDFKKDQICLSRRSLTYHFPQLLHVLLHETVHKYTGSPDNTREFEKGLLDVAVDIVWKSYLKTDSAKKKRAPK